MEEREMESWRRYAREGYVKACDRSNHRYTVRVTRYLAGRIEELEKRVAIHEKIATQVIIIFLSFLVFRFLSRIHKYLES